MKEIFAGADLVVAWLGPEADSGGYILDALSEGKDGPKFFDITRSALISFLTRPWWARVWIVQEFMVARHVWFLCGSSSANAYTVFRGVTDLLRYLDKRSYYITDIMFRDLLSWRFWFILIYERFQNNGSLPLLELLELTKAAGATDPRDRVFALLGLVAPEESLRVRLDYKLSPCEVFCSATRAMANNAERSEAVMKVLAEWRPPSLYASGNERHSPLRGHVPDRSNCDGVACSSRQLCLELPGKAKPDSARVVQYFIMGLQDPK
jgi:hypothetical protein